MIHVLAVAMELGHPITQNHVMGSHSTITQIPAQHTMPLTNILVLLVGAQESTNTDAFFTVVSY